MAETAAPAIAAVPDIDLDGDELSTAVGDWAKQVKNFREELTDVTTVWARVPTVYDPRNRSASHDSRRASLLQTRDDPIGYAQIVDGGAQGYRW